MSIEQQIQACEHQISRLEQLKHTIAGNAESRLQKADDKIIDVQLSRINKDLDESYQQMAILKIRRMMGY